MEFSSSAITSALRVGVQVVVARKRPVLEIYQTLRNEFEPPIEIDTRNSDGNVVRTDKHRWQDVFVDLHMVNVGGDRAENVTFEVSGDFRREHGRTLPRRLSSTIRQCPPGQVVHIMKIDQHDLQVYEQEQEGTQPTFRPKGLKKDTLTIEMHYDGPDTLLNKLLRLARRFFGKKQYVTCYTFDPANLDGDLPHPTYHG